VCLCVGATVALSYVLPCCTIEVARVRSMKYPTSGSVGFPGACNVEALWWYWSRADVLNSLLLRVIEGDDELLFGFMAVCCKKLTGSAPDATGYKKTMTTMAQRRSSTTRRDENARNLTQ
jgi:hypothetical protein